MTTTSDDPELLRSISEHEGRFYSQQVENVVRRLHQLADEVERTGKVRATAAVGGTPRFASAAESVLHSLLWGIANLNADGIVGAAGRADHAEAQEAKVQA